MEKRLYKGLFIAFVSFWIVFILVDFWQKHPLYSFAIANFQYFNLTLFFVVIGAALGWFVLRNTGNKTVPFYFNWLSVFLVGLFCIVGAMLIYQQVAFGGNSDGGSMLILMYKVLSTAFFTYLILVVCYAAGYLIGDRFELNLRERDWLILRMGLGIMGIVGILFVLGIFGMLNWYILLAVFALIISFSVQPTLSFVKRTLIEPIKIDKKLNWFGFGSFYLLLVIASLNFVQIISPFPTGFDSLTLYANMPSLINDHSGLIEGHQPYNWSLFMALGYILFGQTEVMLSLSFIGGVLCLPAMYSLGKSWLKMDTNYLLLALLLFYMTPVVMHQSYAELKVDLGLLFIYMCIMILFSAWLAVAFKKTEEEKEVSELVDTVVVEASRKAKKKGTKTVGKTSGASPVKRIKEMAYDPDRLLDPYIVLIGLLSGFAMGIKLTTLFVFFAVVAGIWYAYGGKLFYLAVFGLSIFGILLFKIDDMGGLREYHLSAGMLKWVMLLLGIILLGFAFKEKRTQTIRSLKLSVLYGVFFVLPFLPWVIKNYAETKSLSPKTLLNGKATGPEINMKILNENWKNKNGN